MAWAKEVKSGVTTFTDATKTSFTIVYDPAVSADRRCIWYVPDAALPEGYADWGQYLEWWCQNVGGGLL